MSSSILTRPATAGDVSDIGDLHARVFGPGRFTRIAYRVRKGTPLVGSFCRVAEIDGNIVAAVGFTRIVIGDQGRALLLGPLAVDPGAGNQGLGGQVMEEALEAVRKSDVRLVLLVGDEPYYSRYGFKRVDAGQIKFPGPVAPDRILATELEAGALEDFRGLVVADSASAAN